MISCYSHLVFRLRDPLQQKWHTVCLNVVCGKNEVHKSLYNTCSWFTMHHTFLFLPPLVVQVFPGLCRRPKPWTICVSSTLSSASTSPMRLWGRDWATAGSIQPAVESTTWASTHLKSRSHSLFIDFLWHFIDFLEENDILSLPFPTGFESFCSW